MSLTESKILAEVALLPQLNSINVRWDNIIMRDEEVVSRIPHRCTYGQEQKAQFMFDVEDSDKYIEAMGW